MTYFQFLSSVRSMKKQFFTLSMILLFGSAVHAQEKYGKTANLGLGIGYYGYLGHSVPAFHFNYELDVAKQFTLAPFIGIHTYHSESHWTHPNGHRKDYYWYRQTIVPIGVKGTYYFDEILEANSDWDFYLGGSLGFVFVNTRWSNNYYGERHISNGPGPLYLDGHIGAEYHINSKLGLFLDLSTGVSTLGLAIHP